MEEIERKETGEHQNNLNVIYRRSRRALINRFFLFLVVFLFIFRFVAAVKEKRREKDPPD